MANFEFRNVEEVVIKSFTAVMSGQDNRSSYNFDFDKICGQTKEKINSVKFSCDEGITFNIMQDKKAAIDPVVYNDVCNGSVYPFSSKLNGLYVANPKINNMEEQETFLIRIEFIK